MNKSASQLIFVRQRPMHPRTAVALADALNATISIQALSDE